MPNYRALTFSLLALLFSHFSTAEIYKWVDAQGGVHFGEKAPDNAPVERLDDKLQDTGNFVDYPQPAATGTAAASPASAQKQAQNQALQIDIQLVDYQLPAETLDNVRNNIKAMYYAYQLWFGWPAYQGQPLAIKIFGSVKSFEGYQRAKGHKVGDRSYYSGEPDREIIMKGTHPTSTLVTLYHETSHAILHMQQPYTGKWINEGLAEVFSNIRADSRGYPLLKPEAEWVYVTQMMLEKCSLEKVGYYLAIPSAQWKTVSKREERSYYMMAWSIMYFMATTDNGRRTLKEVLEFNRQRPLDAGNLVKAMDVTYPGGIEQLDLDWREALQQME